MNSNYWNNCYKAMPGCNTADCDGWLAAYEIQLQPGFRVLDLGCGAGTNLEMLLSRNLRVSVADFSPDAIQIVTDAFGRRLASADCFDMRDPFPYGNAGFDAVIADLSLHYFTWQDTKRIIGEIERILRPGGMLIARVHSLRSLPSEGTEEIEPGYFRAYGYTRRYFTRENIIELFGSWKLRACEEKNARRYGGHKHVLEFAAEKLSAREP